jgi:hypothetical protein
MRRRDFIKVVVGSAASDRKIDIWFLAAYLLQFFVNFSVLSPTQGTNYETSNEMRLTPPFVQDCVRVKSPRFSALSL